MCQKADGQNRRPRIRMETAVKTEKDIEAAAAALMELTVRNIPPDVQELLTLGNPSRGIAPGALYAAMHAAMETYKRS